jgi:tetratricopeptide (TPR) repeat protein
MPRFVWGAILCLASATALAQSKQAIDHERARTLFEGGRQAYEAGDYPAALSAFEEAYRIVPRPAVAFALAQAHRQQFLADSDPGKLKRAVQLYRKYLEEAPRGERHDEASAHVQYLLPILNRAEASGPIAAPAIPRRDTRLMVVSPAKGAIATIDGKLSGPVPFVRPVAAGDHQVKVEAPGHFPEELAVAAVDGELSITKVDLRPKPALLTLRAPGGAEVAVDGRPVGETPLARPLEVPAGRHFLTLGKRGHRQFARELSLDLGQLRTIDVELEKTGQRRAALWILAGGGALLVAGGVTTTLAFVHQGEAQELDDARASRNLTADEVRSYARHVDRRDDFRLASTILLGGTVALGVTGLLLYIFDTPRAVVLPPPETIVPVVGPDEIGAAWRGQF